MIIIIYSHVVFQRDALRIEEFLNLRGVLIEIVGKYFFKKNEEKY